MTSDQLSTTFAALADPTRRAILARLTDGEATVNELAEPFPMTLQAVSKHLKVLERAGLIARGRSAQLRPSRLQGEALREAAEWLGEDPGAAAPGGVMAPGGLVWGAGARRPPAPPPPRGGGPPEIPSHGGGGGG